MLVYIFFLGVIVGSFVNVVIYRLPLRESFARGRSRCPHCCKRLAWYDLIPIVSFLIIRGRCRHCRKKISPAYPLIELYSGFVFAVSYRLFGNLGSADWMFIIFILELLLILAVIDLRHLILPDSLLLVLVLGAIVYGLASRFYNVQSAFNIISLENLFAAFAGFLFFGAVWFFSRGRGVGLGDAKLAGILGFVLGPYGVIVASYGGIVVGAIVGLAYLLSRRGDWKTKLPLGTFMCFAATIYVFFGGQLKDIIAVPTFLIKNLRY